MPQKKSQQSRKIIVLISLLAIVVLIGVLEATNTTHFFHKKPLPVSASSYTKGEQAATVSSNNKTASTSENQSSNSQPGDQKSSTGGSGTTLTLLAPTGDFVNNHHPKLNDKMTSTCTTTPGASCTIAFTRGSETHSLPSQVTDRGGSTYWDWTPQDSTVNLSQGTWEVKAIATLNGKTLSATDATQLEVTQ